MVWNLEDNPLNKHELKIYRYIFKQSGSKELAHTVSRFVDLREYLDSHPFKSAAELRQNVLTNGIPVFSKPESEHIFKLVSKTGGGGEVLDNVVRQFVNFIYEWQPSFLRTIVDAASPFIFILKTLELNPEFGPLLGIALDSVSAVLPVVASSIENIAPEIAGPPGAIIGWMIASVFVGLSMMLHVSRAHFGQAFNVSFLLIPFLGTSLYNAATSGEKLLEKVADKRKRLMESAHRLFGKDVGDTVEGLIPNLSDMPDSSMNVLPSLEKLGIPPSPLHALADAVEGKPATAGKRLSRRAHSKAKWRTQRKLK